MEVQLLTNAQDAYRRGQLQEVIRLLGQSDSLDEANSSPETLALLGLAHHDLGRPYEAADAFERASLIGPISDEARIALASSYAQLRRIDLARELYLQLALSRRLSHELMLQVAAGLAAIDAPQLAMKVCEWITEQDDTMAQAYYDMGIYSATCGNELYLTEALTRRALQLDPGNVHYRIGLVSLLIQLHQDKEAIIALGDIDESKIATARCVSCLNRIAEMLHRHDRDLLAVHFQRRIEILRQSRQASKSEVK